MSRSEPVEPARAIDFTIHSRILFAHHPEERVLGILPIK
jgi:hypothetical protein